VEGSNHGLIKADSHMPCGSHAVPLSVEIVSFPFDLHSAAVFDSHMPCPFPAMPRICRSESDLSRQGRDGVAAGSQEGNGMVYVN
jgi:hypothetical protein